MKTHTTHSKFKNQYRIPSARIKDYDYSKNGKYFITICTANKKSYFGKITNQSMQLSDIGIVANQLWHEIPNRFPVALDEWIVMPNHLHGIVAIDHSWDVENNKFTCFTNRGGVTGNKNPMLHSNLSSIIRWYKGRSSFEIRKINPAFSWQARFYDHVIRNEQSLNDISEYIINNPLSWEKDNYYEVGLETP